MPRKPKLNVTDKLIGEVEKMAENGFNQKQIAKYLDISVQQLHKAYLELLEAIKRGQDKLRIKVSQSILNNATDLNNPTVQIFLAKKLRLFDDTFDSITLKKSDDVLNAISKLFKALSEGEISEDKAKQLQSILDSFTKAYELNELEQRITLLEENTNEN